MTVMNRCGNCSVRWTGGRPEHAGQCPGCGYHNLTGFLPLVRPDGNHNPLTPQNAYQNGARP